MNDELEYVDYLEALDGIEFESFDLDFDDTPLNDAERAAYEDAQRDGFDDE